MSVANRVVKEHAIFTVYTYIFFLFHLPFRKLFSIFSQKKSRKRRKKSTDVYFFKRNFLFFFNDKQAVNVNALH
jgi:hypothetical protein